MRATFPDYAALHSHALQDVLARLDATYQAFFVRLPMEGSGFPQFQGRSRYRSFTYKAYGNGAHLNDGSLAQQDRTQCSAMMSPDCGDHQDGHGLT